TAGLLALLVNETVLVLGIEQQEVISLVAKTNAVTGEVEDDLVARVNAAEKLVECRRERRLVLGGLVGQYVDLEADAWTPQHRPNRLRVERRSTERGQAILLLVVIAYANHKRVAPGLGG